MKKILAIAFASVLLLTASFSLYGCAENKADTVESVRQTETASIGGFVEISASKAAPDYEYQLWDSDDVVLGEVIEELESRDVYASDDGYAIDGVITSYLFKVEKSYKGLLSEGDTITVSVWNYPDNMVSEDGVVFEVVSEMDNFYLQKGQHGVFMLSYPSISSNKEDFFVAYKEEGIFEPKESGIALINEDAAEVYASPSFEITLDQISADIERADEKFGDRSEAPVNGGGIFVDEGQSNEVE